MFFIRQLECVYCDVKNPARSTDRDRVKEIESYAAYSLDEAKEKIMAIISRFGGVEKLQPKILTNKYEAMWIECDRAHRAIESNGIVDIKCLAFEICFKPQTDSLDSDCNLKTFERSLGPGFSL